MSEMEIVSSFYPEAKVGGYTSVDGSVEFYGRINSILDSSMTVLDFGAGRAAWYEVNSCLYRKQLRNIRGKVAKVVGCDVDEAVLQNQTVDESVIIKIGEKLPFGDNSFDMIISDYTFEHIANPGEVAAEFRRILRPKGWICARTPNKYSYISALTRIIKNKSHAKILKHAQPHRKEVDVFPTTFLLNSKKDLSKHFPSSIFHDLTYKYESEPAYHFNSKVVFAFMLGMNFILPNVFKSNLHIFLRMR